MNEAQPIYKPTPGNEFVIRPQENHYIVGFRDLEHNKIYSVMLELNSKEWGGGQPDEFGKVNVNARVFYFGDVSSDAMPGAQILHQPTIELVIGRNLPKINNLIDRYNKETPWNVQLEHMSIGAMKLILNKIMRG